MIHYRRTQVSWPAVVPLGAMALVMGSAFLWARLALPLALVAGVMTLILLLFATMTVIVDDSGIEVRFGVGVVRKRVPFDGIRTCRVVRNPWYYGWGIHFIPGGMLYNASGLSAVELGLTNGRVVRIGSAEPEALAAALPRPVPNAAQLLESEAPRGLFLTVPLIIAAVLTLVVFMIRMGMQPPDVRVTADSFTVSNGPYSNTVPFRRISAVSLDNYIPRVRGKTNGFAAGDTLRGSFRVDTWGSARLYVNLNHPPFVVVRSDDGFVAVNFANPRQTRDMYAELRQALDRSR